MYLLENYVEPLFLNFDFLSCKHIFTSLSRSYELEMDVLLLSKYDWVPNFIFKIHVC